jgi:hypothetical protein
MSDLSDLRQVAREQDEDFRIGHETVLARHVDDGKLFGMTAVERMFVAAALFGVTVVISLMLLLVTESIAF